MVFKVLPRVSIALTMTLFSKNNEDDNNEIRKAESKV